MDEFSPAFIWSFSCLRNRQREEWGKRKINRVWYTWSSYTWSSPCEDEVFSFEEDVCCASNRSGIQQNKEVQVILLSTWIISFLDGWWNDWILPQSSTFTSNGQSPTTMNATQQAQTNGPDPLSKSQQNPVHFPITNVNGRLIICHINHPQDIWKIGWIEGQSWKDVLQTLPTKQTNWTRIQTSARTNFKINVMGCSRNWFDRTMAIDDQQLKTFGSPDIPSQTLLLMTRVVNS